jgi:hypothetical protein
MVWLVVVMGWEWVAGVGMGVRLGDRVEFLVCFEREDVVAMVSPLCESSVTNCSHRQSCS